MDIHDADSSGLAEINRTGLRRLHDDDPELFALLEREGQRQSETLAMVAASSIADPSVLACLGTPTVNVTTEGYPGARFHAGCELVDSVERMAIDRARAAFGARYANVQPHSGSSANAIVILGLLEPGDTILGLNLFDGGHLTHGAKPSVTGHYFNAVPYGLDESGVIDMDRVRRLAHAHRPRLIVCGATSYSRPIEFSRFREIADEVGAYVLADVSHIAGLIVAGEHESPIDQAHFTTTSTYKQLFGPRGGLILIGRDVDTLAPDGKRTLRELAQQAVFPYVQGTPNLGAIAAKARAFAFLQTPEFRRVARAVVDCADELAVRFVELGYRVLTGGTANHTVLVDVLAQGITGVIAERALEECSVIVNKNRIPGDRKSAFVTSGLRLGTNSLALRGMGRPEMAQCAQLVHRVLRDVRVIDDKRYELDVALRDSVRLEVSELCRRFPIPDYPVAIESASS